ncbi:hypothetical protein CEXT_122181, partial [Caerostris extrusa]
TASHDPKHVVMVSILRPRELTTWWSFFLKLATIPHLVCSLGTHALLSQRLWSWKAALQWRVLPSTKLTPFSSITSRLTVFILHCMDTE